MRKILKASAVLGVSTFVTLVVGVAKNKILALSLGPVGVGMLAQLNSFLNTANSVTSMGLTQGVTKYVAENRNLIGARFIMQNILRAAIKIIMQVSVPVFLLVVIFSSRLSLFLLNDRSLYVFFIIIALAIPIQALAQIYLSFAQGFKAVKSITAVSVSISFAGLMVFSILIHFFKITGAVFSILTFSGINFILFWVLSNRIRRQLPADHPVSEGKFYTKSLFSFGYMRLIQTSIYPLTLLVIRAMIIRNLGLFSNGLYESALAYSFMFVPLINNILWSYTYPNYCSAKDNLTLFNEVNKFLKISLFIAVPVIVIIIIFRNSFIKLLFSAEFLPATGIIAFQLMGDFLKVIIWPFNVVLMAKDKMKTAVLLEVVWNICFLMLSFYFMGIYKLKGVFIAQNISLILLFVLTYIYTRSRFKLKVDRGNLLLILLSLLFIAVVYLAGPVL